MKGILKSRPVTPDVSASVGEKSKVSFLLLHILSKKKLVPTSGTSRDGAEHDQPRQKVMLRMLHHHIFQFRCAMQCSLYFIFQV